jgi:hypothetical protein
MNTFRSWGSGRKEGALGVFYSLPPITFEFEGAESDLEGLRNAARLAYYEAGYEHVSVGPIHKLVTVEELSK